CVNYVIARKNRWHERFIEYRLLSEQLRHLEAIAPLGIAPLGLLQITHSPPFYPDQPREHWTTWYVRRLARRIGLPDLDLNQYEIRGQIQQLLLTNWIIPQYQYHCQNAHRTRQVQHWLHRCARDLLIITFIACAFHILVHHQSVYLAILGVIA